MSSSTRIAIVSEFEAFANSLNSGYIKFHKAMGMIDLLHRGSCIMKDATRLHEYVSNCLAMEGFRPDGINKIVDWLSERREAIAGLD